MEQIEIRRSPLILKSDGFILKVFAPERNFPCFSLVVEDNCSILCREEYYNCSTAIEAGIEFICREFSAK